MAHLHYTNYYVRQAQTGQGMNYFAGMATQKGHGIGSFLGGLFRTIFPFLQQGAQAVGREALRAGSHVLADVASGVQPLGESVKRHASEVGQNLMTKLSEKMKGNGIKRLKTAPRAQSRRVLNARRTAPKAKQKTCSDIFS
jgi:hypothetical protein